MYELCLLRSAGLGMNVLEVGLGRVLSDPQHLSRFLDANAGRHGEEHAELARREIIELGEGLTWERRHEDRVLHENCCHSREGAAIAFNFAVREREDGGD